jgi:hypothetical protein
MPVHRRRFRIEQALAGEVPMPSAADGDVGPMHREIMTELRAIRAQMGRPVNGAGTEAIDESVTREVAEANALLETYRAQIEQCESSRSNSTSFTTPSPDQAGNRGSGTARASMARKWPRSPASWRRGRRHRRGDPANSGSR